MILLVDYAAAKAQKFHQLFQIINYSHVLNGFFPTVFPSHWFLLIHFFNSKTVFLYCSETTENLLMCNPTYSHLKDYIVNI